MTIVDFDISDRAALSAVMQRAFDPRYGEAWTDGQCIAILGMPGYALRMLKYGQQLAGFAMTRQVAQESELLLLAVDPRWRRRGLASLLLDDWQRRVAAANVVHLYLEMRADNEARALYEQSGFREIGLRPNYYRGNDGVMRDAVTMSKLID